MADLPDARDVNYWKTSKSSPGAWLEKAQAQIEKAGGRFIGQAFGIAEALDAEAYMLEFEVQGQRFRVIWPVLPHDPGDALAARRQATTLLFYDVKGRCISARVLGFRRAFFSYLRLADGRVAGDLAAPELVRAVPEFLRQLPSGAGHE